MSQLIRAVFFVLPFSIVYGADAASVRSSSPISLGSLTDSWSVAAAIDDTEQDERDAADGLLSLARADIFEALDSRAIRSLIDELYAEVDKIDSLSGSPVYGKAKFQACFVALAFAFTTYIIPAVEKSLIESVYGADLVLSREALSGQTGIFCVPSGIYFYYQSKKSQTFCDIIRSATKMFFMLPHSLEKNAFNAFIKSRFDIARSIINNRLIIQQWWFDMRIIASAREEYRARMTHVH